MSYSLICPLANTCTAICLVRFYLFKYFCGILYCSGSHIWSSGLTAPHDEPVLLSCWFNWLHWLLSMPSSAAEAFQWFINLSQICGSRCSPKTYRTMDPGLWNTSILNLEIFREVKTSLQLLFRNWHFILL